MDDELMTDIELDGLLDDDEESPDAGTGEEIVLATVANVAEDGITLIIDGEEEAGEKKYKVNTAVKFATGDRVKIFKNSGTYLVEYKIGAPMADYPIPAGGSDGQVLMKDGSNDFAVKWGNAHGVPSGGDSGYVLTKNSGTDYDLTWAQPHWLPSGGTNGQVLAKSSATDYSVAWVDAGHGVPSGGTTGQALTKKSNTNYDLQWSDVKGIPSGGTTGQYLMKSSNTNYAVEWGSAPTSDRLKSGTKQVIYNGSALYADSTASLGSSNYYWNGCYLTGAIRLGNNAYNSTIGFFGTTPQSQKRVGSSGTLASLISALQGYGLIS